MACPTSAAPDLHERGLDEFYRLGGNCIHIHGEGGETHSRKATGEWLRRHQLRSQFFLCTQIAHEGWDAVAGRAIDRFTPEAIAVDIAADLKLLGTDYLDFVYLADNPGVGVGPVVEALAGEVARGRIRSFGVRNWCEKRIREANAHAVRIGASGVAAVVTNELSLFQSNRPLWPEDIPFSQLEPIICELRLPVFAHAEAFNQGLGLLDDQQNPTPPRWMERWNHPANPRLATNIQEIAAAREVSPLEIILAWILTRPFTPIALISLPNLLALGEVPLVRSSNLALSPVELAKLRPG